MLHSVRARLTIWYTAILALVLITFSAMSYTFLARTIRSSTDSALSATAHEFGAAFTNDRDVRLDFRVSDRDIIVFSPDGRIVASTHRRLTPGESARMAAAVRRGLDGFATIDGGVRGNGIRLFAKAVNVLDARYVVVIAEDLRKQAERLRSAARAVFLGIPLALLVAAGGGYLMARKSLAPVTMMSIKARQISAETLGERIDAGNERDELGFLAMTLNELLERLQHSFDLQRHFMADASHELRTPVAIIQGEADVSLSRSDRTSEEYRESMEIMQNAARRLTRIVNDLFLLARSDAGRYPVRKSRFYLDELLADCVRVMRSLAAAKGVELTCDAAEEAVIVADEELLHRMFLNLLDNAVKFTAEGARVTVRAEESNGAYVVRVVDRGSGIPPEDVSRIFERFYRGDRARRRGTTPGGAGLGLPIARWIAEIHEGKLEVERTDPSGSTFRVELPRARD